MLYYVQVMSMCLILVFILGSVVAVGITAVAKAVNKVGEDIKYCEGRVI